MQIEVRVSCPQCGSSSYPSYGKDGDIIYRRCKSCGHEGKAIRKSSETVIVITKAG